MAAQTAPLPASHFLTGEELDREELLILLERAAELKRGRERGEGRDSLEGRSVALIFEKPSTRTRISFEVGVAELGATPIVLRADELQLTRGESTADTARVLSGYLHGIVIRSGSDERVRELAAGSTVRGGEMIGRLGRTGVHHSAAHLHFGLSVRERGHERYVDPEPYLREWMLVEHEEAIAFAPPSGRKR